MSPLEEPIYPQPPMPVLYLARFLVVYLVIAGSVPECLELGLLAEASLPVPLWRRMRQVSAFRQGAVPLVVPLAE